MNPTVEEDVDTETGAEVEDDDEGDDETLVDDTVKGEDEDEALEGKSLRRKGTIRVVIRSRAFL
jgi:hypothetical protein